MKREIFDLDITEEDIYKYYDYEDIVDDDIRHEFLATAILDGGIIILLSVGLLLIDKANANLYYMSIIVVSLLIAFAIIFNYYIRVKKMEKVRIKKIKDFERKKQLKLQRQQELQRKRNISIQKAQNNLQFQLNQLDNCDKLSKQARKNNQL